MVYGHLHIMIFLCLHKVFFQSTNKPHMQNADEKAVPAQDPTTGPQDTYEDMDDMGYIKLP